MSRYYTAVAVTTINYLFSFTLSLCPEQQTHRRHLLSGTYQYVRHVFVTSTPQYATPIIIAAATFLFLYLRENKS